MKFGLAFKHALLLCCNIYILALCDTCDANRRALSTAWSQAGAGSGCILSAPIRYDMHKWWSVEAYARGSFKCCPSCRTLACPQSTPSNLPSVQPHTAACGAVMQAGKADSIAVVPLKPLTDNIEDFLVDLKAVLDENQIAQRPIHYVLSSNTSLAYPMCQGQVRSAPFACMPGLHIKREVVLRCLSVSPMDVACCFLFSGSSLEWPAGPR